MIDRRSFLEHVGVGLSAMLFTPHIVRASWKDTLRANSKYPFSPHWVLIRERWLRGYHRQCMFGENQYLTDKSLAAIQSMNQLDPNCDVVLCPTKEDYLYCSKPWYEDLYPEVRTLNGIFIHPFEHMPPSFSPQSLKSTWFSASILDSIRSKVSTRPPNWIDDPSRQLKRETVFDVL